MIPDFETTFAVPLSCEACIKSVSTSLYKLDGKLGGLFQHPRFTGLTWTTRNQRRLCGSQAQLISVTGNAAPSAIVSAIQETGRDAILRGSGKGGSAAVCILETHSSAVKDVVRGLIRMVQVGPSMTVLDMTLRGVSPGTYNVTVRESGDISNGAATTGGIWDLLEAKKEEPSRTAKGVLGTIEVGKSGLASVFLDKPIQIWEMLGRSIVVSRKTEQFDKEDPDTLVGVIARSAGVWDNDKTVCSCSGKTVWEERDEQTSKGML